MFGFAFDARTFKLKTELLWCFTFSAQKGELLFEINSLTKTLKVFSAATNKRQSRVTNVVILGN